MAYFDGICLYGAGAPSGPVNLRPTLASKDLVRALGAVLPKP